jgi:hypothetical protein
MVDLDLDDLGVQVRRVLEAIRAGSHEHWWLRPEVAAMFEDQGYHLVPQHFYGPLPSNAEIEKAQFDVPKYPLEPLGWHPERCAEVLGVLLPYWHEFKAFAGSADQNTGFRLNNVFYTGVDAFVLYALVRVLRPKRIVEIGSGFSTHVAHAAMQRNGVGSITCIEPYPTPKLRELSERVEIIASPVQDVDMGIFAALAMNDIVFIDSSHVSKLDSDVNVEIFRILPNLKHQVVVHFHDIFLPFEYPARWLKEVRWFWNEQYILYAHLLGARYGGIELIFPVYFAAHQCHYRLQQLAEELPGFSTTGVGFWFRIRSPLTGDPAHPSAPAVFARQELLQAGSTNGEP